MESLMRNGIGLWCMGGYRKPEGISKFEDNGSRARFQSGTGIAGVLVSNMSLTPAYKIYSGLE
jgi:hypothetical protein